MFRIYMFLALFAVVGGSLYGAYAYYKDSQARISQLTANNATLKSANQSNLATIDSMQATAQLHAS